MKTDSQSTEIDRVFTDSEVRLLRIRATLLELSPTWYDPHNTRIQLENPLPIRSEDGRLLGYASVSMEGSRLVADMSIDYATPERLTIQNGSPPLYAVPVGEVKFAHHVSLSDWNPGKPTSACLLSVWGVTFVDVPTFSNNPEPLTVGQVL